MQPIKYLGDLHAAGYIAEWVDPRDPRPLWQQVHDNYAHGGGWCEFEGFTVTAMADHGEAYLHKLSYPGDPPYVERARIVRGDEMLCVFQHSWVLWIKYGPQDNGGRYTYKVARID